MATYLLQRCHACAHEFRAPEKLRGRTVRCPYCGTPLEIGSGTQVHEHDHLVGRVVLGCRLEKRLGAGAMAAVYQASRLDDGKSVAVKLLSNKAAQSRELRGRFQRECDLGQALNHPGIVKVYQQGEDKGALVMVMELVEGTNLQAVLAEEGRLSWKRAAGIVRDIALALKHMGEKGIIHRDIKPGNIIIRHDGAVKLVDLGLGKQLDDHDEGNALTMQGARMGTPAYMAPEQVVDASSATASADVWALGATFYHLVTGREPFQGRNASEVMIRLRKDPVEPPSRFVTDLPRGIDDLMLWMLEKDPLDRPQDPSELIMDIDAALDAPTQIRRARRRQRTPKSNHLAWVLTMVIVVLLIAAVFLLLQR